MRRLVAPSLLVLFAACSDTPGGGGNNGEPDAGAAVPAYPDATIITRIDVGVGGPEAAAPTLDTVTPGSGSENGGTRVTLRGTSFVEPAEVYFGASPALNVVVLDEVSIAATTPAGVAGPVTVKVATPGGVAELPNGFRYIKDLKITSVDPLRIPEEGGVMLAIRGKGFDEKTIVLLDRKPLAGQRVVDSEHIEGYAPALNPGRPEIRAFNAAADVRRSDLLVVFATPEITSLAPGYGPIGGGSVEAFAGDGFEGAELAQIGTNRAPSLSIESGERLSITTPSVTAEGAYDVRVANADASATLANGYIAFDPRRVGREIIGVTPRRVPSTGGTTIAIVGYGFGQDATVTLGTRAARVTRVMAPNAVEVVVPAGLAPGLVDVAVDTGGSTLTAPNALEVYAPMTIGAIDPASGPAAGGTAVTITGTGFAMGAEVRIGDVPLADVMVVSGTQITGRTVAGSHGAQDVVVRQGADRAVLRGGFKFEEPFEVIKIDPVEGSIAGKTYVTALGRGFEGPVSVSFGGVEGDMPKVENASVISVRTKPSGAGWVDVLVKTPRGEASFPRGFLFYDPRIVTGGAWGGPIEGSVNVGVLNAESGDPVPGMVVQLGYDADPRYRGITDENGVVTISAPEIRGAQTITAGLDKWEFTTFMEVNARNVTIYASHYPESPPPDAPVPPCPTGGEPPKIKGRVYKFKSSLDPVTRPGWIPIARVTYTQANVFSPNPPMPPEQVDYVFMDGGEYEIVTTRAGTVAVYAILGDFNQQTQEFIPRRMGIVRQVPSAPATTIENVNIALDIELDRSVLLRLDQPPVQDPGPTANAVFPYLNLGSEGVIAFPAELTTGQTEITLSGLPNISGSQFFYLGGSWTERQPGRLGAPSSQTITQSSAEVEAGIDLGPFLEMPENVSPKFGTVAPAGKFRWDQPGITPDITTLFVLDVTGVSGCCCEDQNMNGTCEDAEPQMCGGAPVQFTRWTVFGKGGLMSYDMPRMPSGVKAFDTPRDYFWVVQEAIAPRFNYDEFIYNQFSPYFWKSWVVWYSQFLAKEETD